MLGPMDLRAAGSTSCLSPHGPGSEGPRWGGVYQLYGPKQTTSPWGRGVNQLSWPTRSPGPRGRWFDKLSKLARSWGRRIVGSTRYPGPLSPGTELTRGRPAVPAETASGPSSDGGAELTRYTGRIRTLVRGAVGSTSYPGRLGIGSELMRGRPAVPADSDPGLS